jgi:hypothetical protein
MAWKTIIVSLAAGALVLPAAAQELSPELQALDEQLPGTLVNDPTRLDWETQGEDFRSKGFAEEGIPGGGAAREFVIRKAGPQPYSIQTYVPLLTDIEEGETLTVGFWARATDAKTDDGKGVLGVRFQQNADPWPGFGDTTVELGPEWEWHEVSAVATTDVQQRYAVVTLQLAGARQTVQIGQTIVVKGVPAIVGAAAPAPSVTDEALASLAAQMELPPPLRDELGRLANRPDRRGWGDSGPAGSFAERDEPGIWLGKATRYTAAEKGANRWDVSTAIPLEEGIEVGDKLLIAIAARTESAATEDGNAVVGIRVQSSDPPHPGFADNLFKVGSNWQLVRLRTTATEAIPAGKATIALHFAEAPQAVDIGPVYVLKLEE